MSYQDARPRFLLSAFAMNTPSHILGGGWRHPQAEQHRFAELDFWVETAQKLESACFDALFFADVVGLYGDHDGGWASHVQRGLQIPAHDPLVLASALAARTEHLGLAVTSSIVQSHPFHFARQISTLDHLSHGRVAWNIVTSALANSFRNFGYEGLPGHDERYEWAEEYLQACYRLWEGSWEDEALRADKVSGVFADPDKVHKIHHCGPRYEIEGPHLVSPSPQRTPLLFQAGSSTRGLAFGGSHAEAAFLFAPHPEYVRKKKQALQQAAVTAGRSAQSVKVFAGLSFVVGSTEAEVQTKKEEFDRWLDVDAIIAHIGGGIGVDLGGLPHDTPLSHIQTEASRGVFEALRASVPDGEPTIADIARYRAYAQQIAGTPEQIVDQLQCWQDAGVDGINIINQFIPGSYDDFIDYILPELRRRNLAQTQYQPGTLREKFFGGGPRLGQGHPAAEYRPVSALA